VAGTQESSNNVKDQVALLRIGEFKVCAQDIEKILAKGSICVKVDMSL